LNKYKISSLKSVSTLVIINILLAALALIKDILLASYMGTSSKADGFLIAFFIPDMIGNNLLANTIGTSCIPIFSKLYTKKKSYSINIVFNIINIITFLITAFVVIVIGFYQKAIIDFLGYGFTMETKRISSGLLKILIPTIIIYPLVSIGSAILQVAGKFVKSSIPSIIFSSIFLISTIMCYKLRLPVLQGIYVLSVSVLIAEILVFLVTYYFVFKLGFYINILKLFYEIKAFWKLELREALEIVKLSYKYFIVIILPQLILYYERYLCSGLLEGSVSALNYAYRIAQFPIWTFVSAINVVIFPQLSKGSAQLATYSKTILTKSIIAVLVINLPIMIILSVLSIPITSLLFQRNNFDNLSVVITADILRGYSLAILGQSISLIVLRYMISVGKIKRSIFIYFIFFITNMYFDFVLVKVMGINGIGYGAALAWGLCSVLMIFSVKVNLINDVSKHYVKLVKLLIANILVIIICSVYKYVWLEFSCNFVFINKFIYACTAALICISIYVLALKVLNFKV
jgi:murein biosynthesis integral membrane protein MurJ